LNHDSVTSEGQETAALYALGALSQHEARVFDAHLRDGCEVCAAELAQFDTIVGVLGEAAEPAVPPAYLRDLLAVRIEKEASESRPASSGVIRFPEKSATIRKPTPAPSPIRTLLPWAAAAVLLLALAYTFTSWRSERESLLAAVERERERASESVNEALVRSNVLAEELAQINSVLSSPQMRVIQLAGLEPSAEPSAKIYWDVQGSLWVVTADLPPAPAGKVYQLWFVTPTAKISAGLIKPDKSGHGFSVVQFPATANPLAAAAITVEPEGGSEQPTTPILALGKPT
jgi:anti-sigma-K factor RskA